jgi:RNA polymerase sigma-70 factor (sigma-E family)
MPPDGNPEQGLATLFQREECAVPRDDEFAAFVAARYRALVRTGLLLTGDSGHAEDLTQSALIRTYLAWGRLHDPANAEAYARRTLLRLALRARQRRWTGEIATGRGPNDGAGAYAPSWAGPDDLALDVRRALAALPTGQRAVLVLRYLDDLSEADTARLLGISLGTVKSRAAELPDNVQPPVARLVESARRRRRLQVVLSLLGVATITAAAFTLPAVLRGPEGFLVRVRSGGIPPQLPTAEELAHARWSAMPPSPLGPRSDPILAWTGSKLLELGGTRNGMTQWDGAAFDTARRQWRRIAPVPGSIGLNGAVSVWTGPASHQLFVTNNVPAVVLDRRHRGAGRAV